MPEKPVRIIYNQSQIHIEVYKAGLLNSMGHDLELAANKFQINISGSSETQYKIKIIIDAASLKVLKTLSSSVIPLSPKDTLEIENTIREKILQTSKYPHIVFSSDNLSYEGPKTYRLNGELSIKDVTRSVSVSCITSESTSILAQGQCAFLQSDFNIPPYSAMFGALKIQDKVCVTFHIAASF